MTTFLQNLYFWIITLLNDDIFAELCTFFQMFARKKWNWLVSRRTPIFFRTNKRSFALFCAVRFGAALHGVTLHSLWKCDFTLINKINSVTLIGTFSSVIKCPLAYIRPTLCRTNNYTLWCLTPHGYLFISYQCLVTAASQWVPSPNSIFLILTWHQNHVSHNWIVLATRYACLLEIFTKYRWEL